LIRNKLQEDSTLNIVPPKLLNMFHSNSKPASSSFGRTAGVGFGYVTGYFLILAIIAFALFGNRSKLIVEEHEGADHGQVVSHGDSHHDDDHHDGNHEQDGNEHPIHHHHIEVSLALVIAVVTPRKLSLFQPHISLPKEFADENCPPSLSSEIVKPPQVA
jgi:hypothetical protein